jgi:hypothetical protein
VILVIIDFKIKVESIVNPSIPIALRTSGHLLLGVVKIYSRKVKYVLSDCNEAVAKIKLQSIQSTKVDLPEKSSVATFATITLPENVNEIELFVPEIGFESDFQISGVDQIRDFDSWETAVDTQRTVKFI